MSCWNAGGAAGKEQGCRRGQADRERLLLQAGRVLLTCVFSKLSLIQANAWICAWLQAFNSVVSECYYLLMIIHIFPFRMPQSKIKKAEIMLA